MDQAEKLRQLMNLKKVNKENKFRVLTVTSGKGGVGKTNFVINLAAILQKRGFRVAILDADFGMANVDILYGVKSKYSVYHLLYEEKNLEEIMVTTKDNIKIIPGGSGIRELGELNDEKREKLLSEFSKLQNIDILLVDTGAGLSNIVLNFVEVADDVIIVTNSEPTALTDAYGLIKVIIKSNIKANLNVVINRVKSITEAKETFEKLSRTVENFLEYKLKYLGYISEDSKVGQAVREQNPYAFAYPKSEATLCLQKISSVILGETVESKNNSIKDYLGKLLRKMGR